MKKRVNELVTSYSFFCDDCDLNAKNSLISLSGMSSPTFLHIYCTSLLQ